MNLINMSKEEVIKVVSEKIATIQKEADILYYKPEIEGYIPTEHQNDEAGFKLNEIIPLKEICNRLGILKEVYEEAYKIYDFRNSGREGYSLVNGKIVKVK